MQAKQRRSAAGFTLVEALISTAIATMAGSALLLGVSSTIQTTDAVVEETLAEGMAQQLMDEIAGCRYVEPGSNPRPTTLGPESGEVQNLSRAAFDDLDDFNGLNVTVPRDLWGIAIGKDDGIGGRRHANFRAPRRYFAGWRQQVVVHYVNDTDPTVPLSAGQTSDYRVVTVRILIDVPQKSPRLITELKRVFAYVPS